MAAHQHAGGQNALPARAWKKALPKNESPSYALRENGRTRVSKSESDSVSDIPEGQRNADLTRRAGQLRRIGFSVEAILAALQAHNAERCDPPLDDDEVRKIATSVGRYPPGDASLPPLDALDEVEMRRVSGGDNGAPNQEFPSKTQWLCGRRVV